MPAKMQKYRVQSHPKGGQAHGCLTVGSKANAYKIARYTVGHMMFLKQTGYVTVTNTVTGEAVRTLYAHKEGPFG